VAIDEPATLVTDYLLGTLSGVLGMRLLARSRLSGQVSVRFWALALLAVAAASYAGGTFHGFRHELSAGPAATLWTATTISMGVASFFLLAAAVNAVATGHVRRWLVAVALLKLGLYVAWMLIHDEFRFVIYEYGSTLAIVLLLVMAGQTSGVAGHRGYIASGILVSMAAAVLQQSGIRLHRHFNHNDLMHVVQMGGVWLLYAGGERLRDAGGNRDGQS
jgi:hypothetical protein